MTKASAQFLLYSFFTISVLTADLSYAQSNQQKADSLRENINLAQKDTNTVNSIYILARTLLELNHNREGIEWADRGIRFSDEIIFHLENKIS